MQQVLPDFGRALAMDGKELPSHANGPPGTDDDPRRERRERRDRRREQDADWGLKGVGTKNANGKRRNKHYWFGLLLHLAVDTTCESPVAFGVTTALAAEQPAARRLLDSDAAGKAQS